MASPGELVAVMADSLGVPRTTVAQYDRVLAENGLRSSGGRGLSAAQVTAADAANLLIAIMGAPISGAPIKDAARTCKLYGALRYRIGNRPKIPSHEVIKRLADLPATHTFHKALVALIDGAAEVDSISADELGLDVQLTGPFHRARIIAQPPAVLDSTKWATLTYLAKGDGLERRDIGLRQSREVRFRTIWQIAATLRRGR
jgi:hypothetical protein